MQRDDLRFLKIKQLIGSVTYLRPLPHAYLLVGRSVIISHKKGGQLHFHAFTGALVNIKIHMFGLVLRRIVTFK